MEQALVGLIGFNDKSRITNRDDRCAFLHARSQCQGCNARLIDSQKRKILHTERSSGIRRRFRHNPRRKSVAERLVHDLVVRGNRILHHVPIGDDAILGDEEAPILIHRLAPYCRKQKRPPDRPDRSSSKARRNWYSAAPAPKSDPGDGGNKIGMWSRRRAIARVGRVARVGRAVSATPTAPLDRSAADKPSLWRRQ